MQLVLLASVGLLWASTEAVTNLSIGTCAELQDAAGATSSDEVVGELVNGGVSCDTWTTFEIAANRLKLIAPEGSSSDDVFVFNNVRLLVASDATLRVLPMVEFTGGDESQEVNGGVLNVAEGGRVRFKSKAYMHDVKVSSVPDEGSDTTSDQWFGGCVYNKGILRFDEGFDAADCFTDGGGESAPGDGSGIWNGATGQVVIKGDVTFTDCGTRDINGNNGGAIYNAGKFTLFDFANFMGNRSSAGGAIFNIGVLKFLKNAMAVFSGSRASDTGGGHVKNETPGTMFFNGGASFTDGFSEDSGGAIWNDGTLRISKSAVFRDNGASGDGGAIFTRATSDLSLPEDTVFEENFVTSPNFSDCENIYSFTDDSFECLP